MNRFETPHEKRLDEATWQRVLELASRLQEEHRSTATLVEVQQVADEIGIDPAFVREALARIALDRHAQLQQAPEPTGEPGLIRAGSCVAVALAFGLIYRGITGDVDSSAVLAAVLGFPAVMLLGFSSHTRKAALIWGIVISACLAAVIWLADHERFVVQYYFDPTRRDEQIVLFVALVMIAVSVAGFEMSLASRTRKARKKRL